MTDRFVIDEQNKKLVEFDPLEFIKTLDTKQRDELKGLLPVIACFYHAICKKNV
jgi:hypothetical protein